MSCGRWRCPAVGGDAREPSSSPQERAGALYTPLVLTQRNVFEHPRASLRAPDCRRRGEASGHYEIVLNHLDR
eukprot:scaffold2568_cov246-Pinguiococcus_pyrenoidosus.AAC.6